MAKFFTREIYLGAFTFPPESSNESMKILVILFCFIYSQAIAQEFSPDPILIDTIVITHSKRPLSLANTSKPITVIQREEIENCGAMDLAQLLDQQAGIQINGAWSNPAKDKTIYMQGAAGEYSLVLIDGIPVHDASTIGNTFDIRNVDLANVQRIEILKGSQSTLFGTEAIAGVINIITRNVQGSRVEGSFSYGSLNSLRSQHRLSMGNDRLHFEIGGSYEETEGQSEAEPLTTQDSFDLDGFSRKALDASFQFQASDHFKLRSFFRYTDYESEYDAGSFADGEDQYASDFLNTGLVVEHQTAKINSRIHYAYTDRERAFLSSFSDYLYRGKLHNVEALSNIRFSDKLNLSAGFDFQRLQMIGNSIDDSDPTDELIGVFLNVFYQAKEQWNLEAGLRFNSHSAYQENINYSVSSSYWPRKDLKFFASVGTAFKAPQLSQLYGPFGPNPNLKPSTSIYANGGVAWYSQNDRIELSLQYFNRSIDDVIVYLFDPGYINQDRHLASGIEFSALIRPFENLQFILDYSYLDGETRNDDAQGMTVVNDGILRQPKHQFQLGMQFKAFDELRIDINNTWLGKRDDIYFDFTSFENKEVELDAFLLTNLVFHYQMMESLKLFWEIRNVFDVEYQELYGYSTLGRYFGIGANYQLSKS